MIRIAAPALTALSLIAAPAQAFDLSAMSDDERAAFRAEIRSYLMENPEVILEAVQSLEQRQAAAQAQADVTLVELNSDEIFNDGFSWVGGNPDGDVTLVEFMDYRCGYCRRAAPEVEELLAADGNIRLIVKEFPILGDDSLQSSKFAIATRQVAGDDAYKQVHDALMAFSGEVTEVALRRIADSLALEADPIIARMDGPEVMQEIVATRALAQRLQINGTPTFVLQDELLRGYLPSDRMQAMVNDKRG